MMKKNRQLLLFLVAFLSLLHSLRAMNGQNSHNDYSIYSLAKERAIFSSSSEEEDNDYVNESFFDDEDDKPYNLINKTNCDVVLLFFDSALLIDSHHKHTDLAQNLKIVTDKIIQIITQNKVCAFAPIKKNETAQIPSTIKDAIITHRLSAYIFVLGSESVETWNDLATLILNCRKLIYPGLIQRSFLLNIHSLLQIFDQNKILNLQIRCVLVTEKVIDMLTYDDNWQRPNPGNHLDLIISCHHGCQRIRSPFPLT